MDSTQDRLAQFVRHTGLSDNQFTLKSGLSNGLLANIIKKKSSFTNDTIEKILYAFPELNIEWVLRGEGEMLRKRAQTSSLVLKEAQEKYQISKKESQIYLFPEELGASFASLKKEEMQQFSLPWLPAGTYWTFLVAGNGMATTLFNGDHVIAKELVGAQSVESGEIHVLLTKNGRHIKRVWKNGESLRLSADNAAYPEEVLEIAEITAVFLVVEKISARL